MDHTNVEAARRLAELLEQQGNATRASETYQMVAELDPFDGLAQARTGRLALQRRDSDRAIRAFRAALATNPADRAVAHLDLGEAYLLAGQVDEAKSQALAALEIAPSFERAQDLLLKIVGAEAAS